MDYSAFIRRHANTLVPPNLQGAGVLELIEKKYAEVRSNSVSKLRDEETLVEAPSMEEAFQKASGQLGIDVSKLQYTIIEYGSKGMFGIGAKNYKIIFSPAKRKKRDYGVGGKEEEFLFDDSAVQVADMDGTAEVYVSREGKFLIIHPPKGTGRAVVEKEVDELLQAKNITEYDKNIVKILIKKKDSKPFRVGDWTPNPKNDGKLFVEISDDRMKGYLRIIGPKADGRYMDFDDVQNILRENKIYHGINEEKIKEAIQKKIYNIPVVAAEGTPVKNGADARIDYKVNIKEKAELKVLDDGSIDFHEMNLIVNVMADQIIAEKIPVQEGTPGKNILGQEIEPKSGKDAELAGGENTEVSKDGLMLKAKINGHLVKEKDILSVRNVFEISGDVGPETGHITNLGSVVVRGEVHDGYNIKAGGNIEIFKSVGSCIISTDVGDIIIKQGVNGKHKGEIISKTGSVYAKYLQDVKVQVEQDVFVTESIISCDIDSLGSIKLNGKKAAVYGGILRVLKEVEAKTIGSAAGTKTVIEVGVDPEVRKSYEKFQEVINKLEPQVPGLSLDIKSLEGQKLDEEKEQKLEEMKTRLEEIQKELADAKEKLASLEEIINSSQVIGKVTAKKNLYTGVVLRCNTGLLENKRDQGPSSYTVDEENRDMVKFTQLKSAGKK